MKTRLLIEGLLIAAFGGTLGWLMDGHWVVGAVVSTATVVVYEFATTIEAIISEAS